jgi:hypothetical protein
MKNGKWLTIWIRDTEGILMVFKKAIIPKNEVDEELPRIEPLTSRFPNSDLELDYFARKFQNKVHKHFKTVH